MSNLPRIPGPILLARHSAQRDRILRLRTQSQPATCPDVDRSQLWTDVPRHGLSRPVPASIADLDATFSRISLRDLQLDTVHVGKYLAVRQLARPYHDLGLTTVVEDAPDGRTAAAGPSLPTDVLLVLNLLSPMAGPLEDASFGLPVQRTYLILEPAYVFSAELAYPVVRVDHGCQLIALEVASSVSLSAATSASIGGPSSRSSCVPECFPAGDLGGLPVSLRRAEVAAWLHETASPSWLRTNADAGLSPASHQHHHHHHHHHHHKQQHQQQKQQQQQQQQQQRQQQGKKQLRSAEEWRLQGNAVFQQGRPYESIVAYTRGLEQHPGDTLLLSNRSVALLASGEPLLAARDVTKALAWGQVMDAVASLAVADVMTRGMGGSQALAGRQLSDAIGTPSVVTDAIGASLAVTDAMGQGITAVGGATPSCPPAYNASDKGKGKEGKGKEEKGTPRTCPSAFPPPFHSSASPLCPSASPCPPPSFPCPPISNTASPARIKACYRLALALYRLQAYERAIVVIMECLREWEDAAAGDPCAVSGIRSSGSDGGGGKPGLPCATSSKPAATSTSHPSIPSKQAAELPPATVSEATKSSSNIRPKLPPTQAAELRDLLARCCAVTGAGFSGTYDFPSIMARHRCECASDNNASSNAPGQLPWGGAMSREDARRPLFDDECRLDLPGYAHPSLALAFIASKKCRGLIAREVIPPGTLLLACKAVGLSRGAGERIHEATSAGGMLASAGVGGGSRQVLASATMIPGSGKASQGGNDGGGLTSRQTRADGGGVDAGANAHCQWQLAQSALAGGRGADVIRWLFGDEEEARLDVDLAAGRLLPPGTELGTCGSDGGGGGGDIGGDSGGDVGGCTSSCGKTCSALDGKWGGVAWPQGTVSPNDIDRIYQRSARCIFTVDRAPGRITSVAGAQRVEAVTTAAGGSGGGQDRDVDGGGACSVMLRKDWKRPATAVTPTTTTGASLPGPALARGAAQVSPPPGGSGFFPTASLFNHSCVPNAAYFFLGDFMFVSATTRVRAGDELTLSYKGGFGAHLVGDQRRLLASAWGFRCCCPLCDHHGRNEALYKRAAVALRAARASLEGSRQAVAVLREFKPSMGVTVDGITAWPHLAAALLILGGHLADAGRAGDAVAAMEEGLGLCPIDSPCSFFFATSEELDAANVYTRLAEMQAGLGLVGAAEQSARMGRELGERMYTREAFPAIAGLA